MQLTSRIRDKQIEPRSFTQIREHYLLEKELATQLKNSTQEERLAQNLYASLYDKLFRDVPHHSQLSRLSNEKTNDLIEQRSGFIKKFFRDETTFLEIGCGSGHLVSKIAKQAYKVYAIDVSVEVAQMTDLPDNVDVIISDGVSIPVPGESIDIAYSHQLMEHLHPDDAVEQLKAIYKALKTGGIYICITPNRLCGPHDISRYFDEVATGFHLKEYSVSELFKLFKQSGFNKIRLYKSNSRLQALQLPMFPGLVNLFRLSEWALELLPIRMRQQVANSPVFFRSITMVGVK